MVPSIVIFILIAGAGLWLLMHFDQKKQEQKPKKRNLATRRPESYRPIRQPIRPQAPPSAPMAPAPQSIGSVAPPPAPEAIHDPKNLLRESLTRSKEAGTTVSEAIDAVLKELDGDIDVEDAARAALDLDFPLGDTAAYMARHDYDLDDIAKLMMEIFTMDANELGDALMPAIGGENLVERVESAVGVVKETLNLSDDDEDFIRLPEHLGCDKGQAAVVLYRNNDENLGWIIRQLKIRDEPELVAQAAKTLEIDLTDTDEYQAMREDDDIEFSQAAAILKACGNDAQEIITAENDHEEFGDGQIDDIFDFLLPAGFTNAQILQGIYQANIMNSDSECGTLVDAALDKEVPIDEIVAFLKEADTDPESLDDELREIQMDTEDRVRIVHAFMEAR